jgi:hypothetical protein
VVDIVVTVSNAPVWRAELSVMLACVLPKSYRQISLRNDLHHKGK